MWIESNFVIGDNDILCEMQIHPKYESTSILGVAARTSNRPALFLHMFTLTLYYPAVTSKEELLIESAQQSRYSHAALLPLLRKVPGISDCSVNTVMEVAHFAESERLSNVSYLDIFE